MTMEGQSVSIYKPVLAIDQIDVSGTPSRVICIECSGTRLFIGTAEGFLIEYFVISHAATGSIDFTRVRHTDLSNKNQPIQYIRAASAIDSLLILSGNQLGLYDIQSLESKGSGSVIRNVTAVSVDGNPISGDPFVVEFCFCRKTSIQLGQATGKGVSLKREITVDSVALTLSMESGLICAALACGYYVMLNASIKNSKPIQLCTFDIRDKPLAIHVKKDEFLVLGPGGLGVFVTKDGTSERPPISWPDKVFQITVHNQLNVVAMGQDLIYVHSLVDYQTCHTISFRGLLKCLSLSEGNLYVVSSQSLYQLYPVSATEQIETLLSSDEIEKALNLLQLSHLKSDERRNLEQKIHRRGIFVHLGNMDFDAAAESIQMSNIDLREIVSLFPKMLPEKSTFTRSLPSLHNFVDVKDITKMDKMKEHEIGRFVTRTLTEFDIVRTSQDLSTALLKMAARYDQDRSFQNLITIMNQLPIDFPDVLDWMKTHKFYTSAGRVHMRQGCLQEALNIWIQILQGKLVCAEEESFPGISIIIDTLVAAKDPLIVWAFFEEVAFLDPTAAVQIFTRKPVSPDYLPLKVAEKLRKWPEICMLYLEHCVEEKDIQDEDCHTYLAALYIDSILEEMDANIRQERRAKLRDFLIHSNCLKLQFLIGRLTHTQLRHELAILHGKAGDHKPALLFFTKELEDQKMAREYCRNLKRREERKEAFLILLGIYLETPSSVFENNGDIVNLLTEFGEEFDLSLVLSMLPDDWSLQQVSSVLLRAVRNSIHKRRQAQLLAGLSRRVSIDSHLRSFQANHGFLVDAESICEVCHKPFDLTDPIFCYLGRIVHERCK